MSKYVVYYNKNQKVYKELGERWARWSKSVQLSNNEIQGISKFFKGIAVRFGLIGEFRELGII